MQANDKLTSTLHNEADEFIVDVDEDGAPKDNN